MLPPTVNHFAFFMQRAILYFLPLFGLLITAAWAELTSSPMIAHLDMREAKIWIQTDAPSLVRIAYANVDDPTSLHWTTTVETDSSKAHTASVTLDKVEPGLSYSYRVELNGKIVTNPARFTSPTNYHGRSPPPDFKIAVGGAHYVIEEGFEPPYKVLGGGYDIFSAISETQPELMIWVGNTAHLRKSDWSTQSGYLKRYTKARSVAQLQPLLKSILHYATWGEQDYGAPNGGISNAYREVAESIFEAYWPRPVVVSQLEGVATQFSHADVDFFVLDVRS